MSVLPGVYTIMLLLLHDKHGRKDSSWPLIILSSAVGKKKRIRVTD